MDLCLCLLIVAWFSSGFALQDGLANTPPMGWSSWNTFFAENDEDKMKGIADAVVNLGLDQYGYVYLTVDDYWNEPERDSSGNMKTNLTRFPSGMKAMGDYLHERGLKYGIYSDAGYLTCGERAGSLGYEQQDLELFISFGIDYLKYDNCYPDGTEKQNHIDYETSLENLPSFYQTPSEQERFQPMADALIQAKSQRDIIFELCLYGWGNVEEWGPDMGHIWRTGLDARDTWDSTLRSIDRANEPRFQGRQGPELGAWNYPDALFTGNGGMTDDEYRTMFALWCAVKSPLMLGTDLRQMSVEDEAYTIITNTELIAVNQDPLGRQAICVKDCCGDDEGFGAIDSQITCENYRDVWQVWQGPLYQGAYIVVVVNRFDSTQFVDMDWSRDAQIPDGIYSVRDLWAHLDIGTITVPGNRYADFLQEHANWSFKLTPA